jgi:hypothetical protein
VNEMGYRERRSFDREPREMHKVTCSDCGKEAEVPLSPQKAVRSTVRSASTSTAHREGSKP